MLQAQVDRQREDLVASFVQIIEISTSRFEEIRALGDEMAARRGDAGTAVRGMLCADRDRPNVYVNVVEFDSYESAMENSNAQETTEFASKMRELCDAPPVYRNLDIVETWAP
jgi:hypothetical protein